jgi:transcriptional regulator with XRE-family HTH domain
MADMLKIYALDLKAVREEQNLSLRTISQQTRLNISVLENIENGDFTFQPQAYIRAFLKQYINSLGLDMEEALFDYDLARSGKYTPKRSNYDSAEKKSKEKPAEVETPRIKLRSTEQSEELTESRDIVLEEKGSLKHSESHKSEMPEALKDIQETKSHPKSLPGLQEQREHRTSIKSSDKKGGPLSFLSSPVIRYISMFLFAALVLIGLYSLVNIMFLEGSNKSPDVIRQNFDDVVKEQERKILGTRTPEEIQDSIRKAEELLASSLDTIVLKVTGLTTGVIYIVTDSINYNKPEKIEFEKGKVGTFKANKSFFISSVKTESFKATVNDIPLKFDKSSVSKVKIDRNGIASK